MVREKDSVILTVKTETETLFPVNSRVGTHVPFAGGLLKKKGVNPDQHQSIKYVKGVSCVDHLSSVTFVTNVPIVAPDLPVGARLYQFWEKWAALGISPKVVIVLKEGCIHPFGFQPNFTWSPTIISCCLNPHRNLYLLEALHQLLNKNEVKPVTTQKF